MKTLIGLVFIALVVLASIFVGYQLCRYQYATEISTEKVLEYLDTAEQSHQQILDNPEWIDGVEDTEYSKLIGTVEDHAKWVKQYQEIKKYIFERGFEYE